ncbi:E3 ubiquitin-protein ligase RNF181-like protein [Leptotrombidium deliense]|uniref:E3 ubiquitin-protein ligase RNF181-like protein n=1 Tax=Leptotrombidium deliense TaxID=299467 RepID=A0A443SRG0_9ACAR|nr:E3 ubiquitin-protein ligase RNF181-like protein [Leptotrombidium deliense]
MGQIVEEVKQHILRSRGYQNGATAPFDNTSSDCSSVASSKVIRKNRIVNIGERRLENNAIDEDTKCTICFERRGDLMKIQCGHVFHHRCTLDSKTICIKGWIEKNSTCPICRCYFNGKIVKYKLKRALKVKQRKEDSYQMSLE